MASKPDESNQSFLTRKEWVLRFARCLIDSSPVAASEALNIAETAAYEVATRNEGIWLDPEDAAACEMDYWDNDE